MHRIQRIVNRDPARSRRAGGPLALAGSVLALSVLCAGIAYAGIAPDPCDGACCQQAQKDAAAEDPRVVALMETMRSLGFDDDACARVQRELRSAQRAHAGVDRLTVDGRGKAKAEQHRALLELAHARLAQHAAQADAAAQAEHADTALADAARELAATARMKVPSRLAHETLLHKALERHLLELKATTDEHTAATLADAAARLRHEHQAAAHGAAHEAAAAERLEQLGQLGYLRAAARQGDRSAVLEHLQTLRKAVTERGAADAGHAQRKLAETLLELHQRHAETGNKVEALKLKATHDELEAERRALIERLRKVEAEVEARKAGGGTIVARLPGDDIGPYTMAKRADPRIDSGEAELQDVETHLQGLGAGSSPDALKRVR